MKAAEICDQPSQSQATDCAVAWDTARAPAQNFALGLAIALAVPSRRGSAATQPASLKTGMGAC